MNTAVQLDLLNPAPAGPDPSALESDLLRLGGWHTAAELLIARGEPAADWRKRRLRAEAAASEDIISGQRGYKHADRSTLEELHHFAAWMESQASEMQRRAQALRRRAHARMG